MNRFQVIILIIFIVFAAIGIALFATFRGGDNPSDVKLIVWGEEDSIIFNRFISAFNQNTNRAFDVQYRQIEDEDFSREVVEAIAEGGGPDIVLVSSDELVEFQSKILPISYETISERSFKDAFVEGGEIFLTQEGTLGFPLIIDPVVMYWNRDILQSNGISAPPKFWSELFNFSERVTEKDQAFNITRSAVALGNYDNVRNAKEILFSMFIQNGNFIVERDRETNKLESVFQTGSGNESAESVIRFYTEFGNPAKTSYSWNRALPNSLDAFVSGDLALYFGFASELREINDKNPNLNFDVAPFPQSSISENELVGGKIKGLSVLKSSKNPSVAIAAVASLVRDENIKSLSEITGLPPVRRGLLKEAPGLAYEDLFYRSALITRVFLDPDKDETNILFKNAIDGVVSGRERISGAVRNISSGLNDLVRQVNN